MATLKEKYKLPKEFKKKWVKALRSGKYKQGQGYLKVNEDSYCCLGVAVVINKRHIQSNFYHYINGAHASAVPKMLVGNPCENIIVSKLSKMNDDGRSFKYIASYIERYL